MLLRLLRLLRQFRILHAWRAQRGKLFNYVAPKAPEMFLRISRRRLQKQFRILHAWRAQLGGTRDPTGTQL